MIANQWTKRGIGRERGGRLAPRRWAAGIAGAAIVACALPASALAGGAPANDPWSGRITLSVPTDTETGTTVGAGVEAGEPELSILNPPESEHRHSVWYRYTPTSTGPVTVDTCASDPNFDSVLGVFAPGAPNTLVNLVEVGSNDEGCGLPHVGEPSSVTFSATSGIEYSIMVANYHDADFPATPGPFTLNIGPPVEPANNDLAGAEELLESFADEFIVQSDNFNADKENLEPNHGGVAGGSSVWYRWTAPADGSAVAIGCSEDLDTTIGVYTGDTYPVTEVASNNDFPGAVCFGNGTDSATAEFPVSPGQELKLAVDTEGGAEGNFIAGFLFMGEPCDPPPNDLFSAGEALTGSSDTATGTNCGASKEAGEPDHALSPGGQSVWYSWTAPANGTATIDLLGSTFDTVLGVYTGGAVGALTEVAANDDEDALNDIFTSKVTFAVTSGTVYRIAVDGFSDGGPVSEGDIALALSLVADTTPPPPPPPPGGGGSTIDQAACDAANDALAAAKAKLKKAKKRLKKAKASGDEDAIRKAKKAVKRAKKRVAAAQAAVEAACTPRAAKAVHKYGVDAAVVARLRSR